MQVTNNEYLPSGNVLRRITTFCFIVEDFSLAASQFPRFDVVKTNVELLTILGVREVRVSDNLTRLVVLVFFFGTLEAVFEFLLSFDAAFAIGVLWPNTRSSVFVEVKSTGALVLDIFAINASVENVANCGVWMGEEAVLSRAEIVLSFWCLCLRCKNNKPL